MEVSVVTFTYRSIDKSPYESQGKTASYNKIYGKGIEYISYGNA
jgi:hypothetical protein